MADNRTLADALQEMMNLVHKYDMVYEDFKLMLDRSLLLGEAMTMIEDLGLFEELKEKHKKACLNAVEQMNKLWPH